MNKKRDEIKEEIKEEVQIEVKGIKDPGLQKGDRVRWIEDGEIFEGNVCEFGKGGGKGNQVDMIIIDLINGQGLKKVKR